MIPSRMRRPSRRRARAELPRSPWKTAYPSLRMDRAGFDRRFMHAKDVPVIFRFAAEHHAASRRAEGWRLNRVVIQAPNYIANRVLIIHAHGKLGVRSLVKILFPEMVDGLVSST